MRSTFVVDASSRWSSRQAQRLESIGQLAAGIAHEINTPIQFVGDSAQFLDEAWNELLPIVDAGEALHQQRAEGTNATQKQDPQLAALGLALEEADLDFLREEIPASIKRTLDGVSRVATIVSGMKAVSHPGGGGKAPADLNEAIESTLVVARNEYKYVAEIDLQLGEIPEVACEVADINQVVLNLVVNAAHAIAENHEEGEMGRIGIRTRLDAEQVLIEIEDDGGGIPRRDQAAGIRSVLHDEGRGEGNGTGSLDRTQDRRRQPWRRARLPLAAGRRHMFPDLAAHGGER